MAKSYNPPLTRRQTLAGLATASAVVTPLGAAMAQTVPGSGMCVITPLATEGPFYSDPKLLRSDIAEKRPGLPLRLVLQVVEAGPCTPIPEARVDIWHSDAGGSYSGYRGQSDSRNVSTVGETFLRGTQISDAKGEVARSRRSIPAGIRGGRRTSISR